MIERMKKAAVLCQSAHKEEVLLKLRNLGVMHLADTPSRSQDLDLLIKEKEGYEKILQTLLEHGKGCKTSEDFDEVHARVSSLIDEESTLNASIMSMQNERERICALGSFDPAAFTALVEAGIIKGLYIGTDKDIRALREAEGVFFLPVAYAGKQKAALLVSGEIPEGLSLTLFRLPEKPLSALDQDLQASRNRLEEVRKEIAASAKYVPLYKDRIKRQEERIEFERASEGMKGDDVSYITGYIPESDMEGFKAFAASSGCAYLLSDPEDEDNPPTKIRYKGFVRIVKPVFDMLGTVPGYREYDISSYFLVFFSLFFAMIIGDGGYGLIFIILGIVMQKKSGKLTDVNILVYVVGAVTVIWGAITGTWFGSKSILEALPFLQALVYPPLANYPELFGLDAGYTQNMLMKFCFIIGALQLGLARVMNIIRKAREKDISLLAEAGWLIDVVLLYLLALNLVIGEPCSISMVIGGVAAGFVLVCVFSCQGPGIPFGEGLKKGLGGFFTTFLDTISSFSNLMSYIRLFAVGMASLAIAQSFNSMGDGLMHGVMAVAGVLVIILGHVLNLVMGLLSVVVHGVRLNLLEFSGALGMEWAGYNYEPFRKLVYDTAENS